MRGERLVRVAVVVGLLQLCLQCTQVDAEAPLPGDMRAGSSLPRRRGNTLPFLFMLSIVACLLIWYLRFGRGTASVSMGAVHSAYENRNADVFDGGMTGDESSALLSRHVV